MLRSVSGFVVPIPTLLFNASIERVLASKLRALATLARVTVEAAPAERFNAPAEVSARVPEVTVDNVKLLDVVEIVDAPNAVAEIAPEVEVRFNAPAVRVNPVENLPTPVTSRAVPGAVLPMPTFPLNAATAVPAEV